MASASSAKPKYWIGTIENCDNCGGALNNLMYDAAVPRAGWGNLCKGCFTVLGCTLGTGHGQKYEKQADGKWLKTDG